jgi:hypothetical protein
VATLLVEIAKLRAAQEDLAARLVEQADDIHELQVARRAKDHIAPAGMAALKQATAYADGFSVETVRPWAGAGAIKAERRGGRRWIDVASLATHVAAKRSGAR